MVKNLQAVFDIKPRELPLAMLMFSYFFLVITCFWILKPIKKGLFIEFYDEAGFDLLSVAYSAAQAELLAKVLNMVVAFGAVVVFTRLSRGLRRQQLRGRPDLRRRQLPVRFGIRGIPRWGIWEICRSELEVSAVSGLALQSCS